MKNFLGLLIGMLLALCACLATAEDDSASHVSLEVEVLDMDGRPVSGVAVSAVSETLGQSEEIKTVSTMNQINRQFAPHFLVVQRGSQVRFPNSDSIKHHVYSFSPAKRFELLLNRGMEEEPLLFDKAGIVELGCNVHDWMLGYIYVVDTPFFAYTDEQGKVELKVPAGNYSVSAWHPRMQEEHEKPSQNVNLSSGQNVNFKLTQKLLPNFEDYQSDEFGEYD